MVCGLWLVVLAAGEWCVDCGEWCWLLVSGVGCC